MRKTGLTRTLHSLHNNFFTMENSKNSKKGKRVNPVFPNFPSLTIFPDFLEKHWGSKNPNICYILIEEYGERELTGLIIEQEKELYI